MSNEPEPVVELRDVHLSFSGNEVLRGVNLQVMPRQRMVILGRSGSGKSTLLRLIMGILRPTSGAVCFNGQSVNDMSRRSLNQMRQRIGMVYQDSALISSLSVAENLALPLEELTDTKPERIKELVEEKLALVGMGEAGPKLPAELSGGMRKRVGLARALMLDPELILYDEPGAGLDPVMGAVINDLIISLSQRLKATSIIVTHEMESAFKVATRMAMLYEGEIRLEASPDAVRNSHDPVVAQFVQGKRDGPIATHQ